MAKAGFDWLVVDLEHSVITTREAEELIRVIDLHNVTPLVRLTSNNPGQIKRMMDAGAHGSLFLW
jgi:2-dehydro-3-deoxyglucarate aldolase